jgi:DNA-binding transcriptional LysR family regulator
MSRMDIEDLRLLVDVVQESSFAAAARRRSMDPSTVSRAITALERDLGARLFQRTSRRLSLTEAGMVYYDRLRGVLEELERAREETLQITKEPFGTLRVTTSVAFGHALLVPLLPVWRETFPALSLDLLLTDSITDLISERIDVAIRLGARPESGMVGARLLRSRYRVCASPRYLNSNPVPKTPVDLAKHDCVLFKWPGSRSEWRFRNGRGADIRVDVTGSIMISSGLSAKQAAVDGVGPTLLPDWLIAAELASGALVDLLPHHDVTATNADSGAWLVYPTRAYLPRKVRTFIDFMKKYLGQGNSCKGQGFLELTQKECDAAKAKHK